MSGSNILREAVLERCIECKLCQKECRFLQKYGKPRFIAEVFDAADSAHQRMVFECSLCGLCSAVCPVAVRPDRMLLEMRREVVALGQGVFRQHSNLLRYESRGISKHFTYYALPGNCNSVLFPGCALSGTRPGRVVQLFELLRRYIPSLGIVFDCCAKPSHDLGRSDYFHYVFGELKEYLLRNGVQNVLVACASCHQSFKEHGGPLAVKMVYEVFSEWGIPERAKACGVVGLHDPCAIRFETPVNAAVREIVKRVGLDIDELPHHGSKTLCCGEGGAVGFLAPELAKSWGAIRATEAGGRKIITYCAGCAGYLNSTLSVEHLLDLIFEPHETLTGRVKVSRSPVTYWNRIRLKRHFKKIVDARFSRERNLGQTHHLF